MDVPPISKFAVAAVSLTTLELKLAPPPPTS